MYIYCIIEIMKSVDFKLEKVPPLNFADISYLNAKLKMHLHSVR